jgi:hypothetical protein
MYLIRFISTLLQQVEDARKQATELGKLPYLVLRIAKMPFQFSDRPSHFFFLQPNDRMG